MNCGKSLQIFHVEESELADLPNDETWCNKVAFLADIFQALNTLKNSVQRKNEYILTRIFLPRFEPGTFEYRSETLFLWPTYFAV
jgi:hypothetical protein